MEFTGTVGMVRIEPPLAGSKQLLNPLAPHEGMKVARSMNQSQYLNCIVSRSVKYQYFFKARDRKNSQRNQFGMLELRMPSHLRLGRQ